MKHLIYTLLIAIVVVACATTQDNSKQFSDNTTENDTIRIANDSLEYEIIIIEPGFDAWLVTQRPRGYFSQNTLEIRNCFSVREYNNRVLDPRFNRTNLYDFRIDYDCDVDYGYEVNYLLYNYFEFFEERYNQRLR